MPVRKRDKDRNFKETPTVRRDAYAEVPAEIRALISERHILASEDPHGYDNLFRSLSSMFSPKNVRQWLLVKDYQDSVWEKRRLLRIKPGIIDSARLRVVKSALEALPLDIKLKMFQSGGVDQQVVNWFTSPKKKEWLVGLLAQFNYSEAAIDGLAFISRIGELETIDKLQLIQDGRQQAICRIFAEDQAIQQLLPRPDNDTQGGPAEIGARGERVAVGGSLDGPAAANSRDAVPDVVEQMEDQTEMARETADHVEHQNGFEEPESGQEAA